MIAKTSDTMSNGKSGPAKAAHVNLMTDTILQNIPADGLRAVMRSILVSDPSFTSEFHTQASKWLQKTRPKSIAQLFISTSPEAGSDSKPIVKTSSEFENIQRRIRATCGSGMGFECLEILTEVVAQASKLEFDEESEEGEELMDILSIVDGDIVQGVTAAGKELAGKGGRREMNDREKGIQRGLLKALEEARDSAEGRGMEFLFERGLSVVEIDNF